MISLQPLHLTHKPSGTWIRLCSTGCFGFLIFLNHAISISSLGAGSTATEWRGSYRHPEARSRTAFRMDLRPARRACSAAQTRDIPQATPNDGWTHGVRLLFSYT